MTEHAEAARSRADDGRRRVCLVTLEVGSAEQRVRCQQLDAQLRGYAAHAQEAALVDSAEDADLVLLYAPSYLFFGSEDRSRLALRRIRSQTQTAKSIAVNLDDRPFPWTRTLTPSVSRSYDDIGLMRSIPYFHYLGDGSPQTDALQGGSRPDLLFVFRGDPGTHPVRQAIVALGNNAEWEVKQTPRRWPESAEGRLAFKQDYLRSMVRGRFVLCPRGRSPASIRLFEVMRAGRAPVVIADDWVPPAGLDWSRVAVFVREGDVPSLPDILRERAEEADAIGRAARAAWEARFSEYTIFDTLVREAWDLLHSGSLPTGRRLARAAVRRLLAGALTKGDIWHYWVRPATQRLRLSARGQYP